MESGKDRVSIAFNFAYSCYLRAKVLDYTPKCFNIGFCLFYQMYNAAECEGLSCWQHAAHDEKLFGIPVKIIKEEEWTITLVLEDFTADLKKYKKENDTV